MKGFRKVLFTVLLLCGAFGVSLSADASTIVSLPVTITENYTRANEFFNYTNEKRVASGTEACQVDSVLQNLAMQRAAELCVYFSHFSPSGANEASMYVHLYDDLGISINISCFEDIAVGLDDAASMYKVWYNSDGHRPLLTDDTLKYYGVGVADYHGTRFWVLLSTRIQLGNVTSIGTGTKSVTHTVELSSDYIRFDPERDISTNSFVYHHSDSKQFPMYNCGDDLASNIGLGWSLEKAGVVQFTVADTSICSVDQLGNVTPKNVGTTTISASFNGVNIGSSSVTVNPIAGYYMVDSTYSMSLPQKSYAYTGSPITPKVTLKDPYGDVMTEGKDYYLVYKDNVGPNAGHIPKDIEICDLAYVYAYPLTEIYRANGGASASDPLAYAWFEITYDGSGDSSTNTGNNTSNNSSTGNSSNTNTGSSSSSNKSSSSSGNSSSSSSLKSNPFAVKLAKTSVTYNGKAQKPKVTVYSYGKKLAAKYYSVTYKSNKNVGKATVTVNGKGKYKGKSAKATFKITLKKVSLSKLASTKKGQLTVKWKKDTQAQGFQVQVSLSKKFSSAKTTTVKGKTKTSATVKSLKRKKTYYVRVRAYKKVGSSTWYGSWSAAKKVKTK